MSEVDPWTQAARLRRLVIGLLITALLAALGAYVLGARAAAPATATSAPVPALFPRMFTQRGFVDHPVTVLTQRAALGSALTLPAPLALPADTQVWLVARCLRGSITLVIGAATFRARCAGGAAGVTGLRTSTPAQPVTARVSEPQPGAWGVAAYR